MEIIETELFEIHFSKDKSGKDNRKFKTDEQELLLNCVKESENTVLNIITFSKSKPSGKLYRIPLIFEKVSKKIFVEKHQDHFAMVDFLPAGTQWNQTIKCNGVEIKSRTALISICPINTSEFFETICHEIAHTCIDSFLDPAGVNYNNKTYFIEGLTEWIAQLSKARTSKELKINSEIPEKN